MSNVVDNTDCQVAAAKGPMITDDLLACNNDMEYSSDLSEHSHVLVW